MEQKQVGVMFMLLLTSLSIIFMLLLNKAIKKRNHIRASLTILSQTVNTSTTDTLYQDNEIVILIKRR